MAKAASKGKPAAKKASLPKKAVQANERATKAAASKPAAKGAKGKGSR